MHVIMLRGILKLGGRLNSFASGDAIPIYQARLLSCQHHGPSVPASQRQIKTDCAVKKDNFNSKVLTDEKFNNRIINDSTTLGCDIELNDLELNLSDRKLILNLTWLRDSCHCSQCTHQFSRQRLFTPKDFTKQIFSINRVQVHEITDGFDSKGQINLVVVWADGHKSQYSLDWLSYIDSMYKCSQLNFGHDDNQMKTKFVFPQDDFYMPTREHCVEPNYWSVPFIMENLKPIDYQDLVDGFVFHDEPSYINANKISDMSQRRLNAMSDLTEQLLAHGLGKIVNVPLERDQVLRVARSMSYERPTGYGTVFDVVVEPNEEINLAYSSQEFDLHSDLTYREKSPGVQLLHCIRNSVDGGYSYFSDAFNAAQILRESYPQLFEVLVQYPATFVVRDPYRDTKFRKHKPVLNLDYLGNLKDVYYSPFMLPPVGFIDDIKLFYLAIDKFTKILQSNKNKMVVKMDPGDLFIFHNRRVLHGRSSYDPTTSNRFLQGCYMDWDEIECLHEKLLSANKIEN